MESIHVVGQGASDMDGNGQMIFSFGRFCWLVGWLGWCLECCVLLLLLRACVRLV